MKPYIKLATTNAPDGSEINLYEHDGAYSIMVDRHELISSRQTESELELARLSFAPFGVTPV